MQEMTRVQGQGAAADTGRRQKPAPMTLLIGRWEEGPDAAEGPGGRCFRVYATLPGGAADARVRATLKELGQGEYVGLLVRGRKLEYKTTTKETFVV